MELVIQAVHAGNTRQTFYIQNLDGDIATAHKKLGQLSLLRDALARVLPVELEYRSGNELGNIIEDLTVYPRPSLEGRPGASRLEGVVIGLSITELGPLSGTSPYLDAPDLAGVTLLTDSGTVVQLFLDLQRPDPLTGQAMLGLLQAAHRTRRPVALMASMSFTSDDQRKSLTDYRSEGKPTPGFIQACEWLTVPQADLDYVYAFIERLGQRYESYDPTEAPALSQVKVVYTTAPGQTPEGDISDNSTFVPQTKQAWVHGDSPLFARLEAALRDCLQVKLGLKETQVHEVELVGHLGSAARPIWIEVTRTVLPPEGDVNWCENVPTIQNPTAADFDEMPLRVSWIGEAYFNEGIWRVVIRSQAICKLLVDGETCCQPPGNPYQKAEIGAVSASAANMEVFRTGSAQQCHVYLNGMHIIELIISGRSCSQPFQMLIYRIR